LKSARFADLVEKQGAAVARSKQPARAAAAPVNAPFSWPNNSLSNTPSANALQLTATKGSPTRSLQ